MFPGSQRGLTKMLTRSFGLYYFEKSPNDFSLFRNRLLTSHNDPEDFCLWHWPHFIAPHLDHCILVAVLLSICSLNMQSLFLFRAFADTFLLPVIYFLQIFAWLVPLHPSGTISKVALLREAFPKLPSCSLIFSILLHGGKKLFS